MKRVIIALVCLVSMPIKAMDRDHNTRGEASSITTTSFSGSSAEMASDDDDDEVANTILRGRDGEVTIDMLMEDYLSGEILSEAERGEIRAQLEGLDETGYRKVIKRLRITRRGRHGHATQEETVVSVLMALVQEMKEHTAQMQSSGETQQKEYEQQVESAEFARYKWRWGFAGTFTGLVVSFVFNILQATVINAANDTNSSSS